MADGKQEKAAAPAPAGAGAGKKEKSLTTSIVGKGTNFVVTAILIYAVFVGNTFRGILWPKFPDIDPNTHEFVTKHGNVFRTGDNLTAKIWVGTTAWPPKKAPLAEFDFQYDWDGFKVPSHKLNASITQAQLKKGTNMLLSVEVKHVESGRIIRAKGGLVKQMKQPEVPVKMKLLNRTVCPEQEEPTFGKRTQIGRGIPQMQVRLVYDQTAYPHPMADSAYVPRLFVDEFWMTNDQLVKLNMTGSNDFESEVHFGLMSAARWRFQRHMEFSFEQNAKVFGEDSEEMLQMRDLFANTNPYLLTVTLVVSVLHMVFEFLAFKNDVEFWQGCDPATLNKFVSVQSLWVGIIMQVLLLLYLWDESANFLVLLSSLVGVAIDVWKVQRAMKIEWVKFAGPLCLPTLVSKVKLEKKEDFDTIAMKWLGIILMPLVIGYAIYTMVVDCHKSWYSYFLAVSASSVYSLGFILMTPQVFINYKHKTVAYLPWRKFVYRAISTFIDDLFAFIIRMPTMHRLSCFRDDVVFFIYLYQRHLYPVDKSRTFDEDGYELSAEAEGEKKDK
mmetsp:Transcript_18367/g.53373  ORF Transcript_18367/g.53373 Transcript_18367/m.53373 type:complete len:556 (+) Transcript_18367:31-1698(+)